MARYTGPKDKISRRFGIPIFGPTKTLEQRNFPPGQHGARNARKKQSDYALALAEKQKLRYMYGVLERQFRNYYEKSARQEGITGLNLLRMLETRLDNVVYRLGFANTRNAARQLVSHGHIAVNGKRVNISNYHVTPGETISVVARPKSEQLVSRFTDITQGVPVPSWLTQDRNARTGVVERLPDREEIDANVNEQLVVELYSR